MDNAEIAPDVAVRVAAGSGAQTRLHGRGLWAVRVTCALVVLLYLALWVSGLPYTLDRFHAEVSGYERAFLELGLSLDVTLWLAALMAGAVTLGCLIVAGLIIWRR